MPIKKILLVLGLCLILAAAGVGIKLYMDKLDTDKIIVYLPYANDYLYKDGRPYKGAIPDPVTSMQRDIDRDEPVPLNLKRGEQKLTLGVRNENRQTAGQVILFIEIPDGFKVTKGGPWIQYNPSTFYLPFGNIAKNVRRNALDSLSFKVARPGAYTLYYTITGNDFQRIRREMTFEAYQ